MGLEDGSVREDVMAGPLAAEKKLEGETPKHASTREPFFDAGRTFPVVRQLAERAVFPQHSPVSASHPSIFSVGQMTTSSSTVGRGKEECTLPSAELATYISALPYIDEDVLIWRSLVVID